jgi:membrane-associated phospholipid phosphatase
MSKAESSTRGKWIGSFLLTTLLLVLSVRYLDVPVALFVRENLYANAHWSRLTSELPDLLLLVVFLTTLGSLGMYLVRSNKGIYDTATNFAKVITWAAPASYLVKILLKWVFGRVNTRYWLENQQLYEFHWFHGGDGFESFPSGHMLVVVTLLAVCWRFYPRVRPYCVITGALLAVALVATDYHFLSDLLSGAYAGVLVEGVVFRMLLREPWRVGRSCA